MATDSLCDDFVGEIFDDLARELRQTLAQAQHHCKRGEFIKGQEHLTRMHAAVMKAKSRIFPPIPAKVTEARLREQHAATRRSKTNGA